MASSWRTEALRQCKSPSVFRAVVAAWGLAVGLEVCLTLDTVLRELLDPRKENRAQRPFTEHGGSVRCPPPPTAPPVPALVT